jgi:hypothetical protein
VAGQCFFPGSPVSSSYKIDGHNITEILLKIALNTITLTLNYIERYMYMHFYFRKRQIAANIQIMK